MSRLQGLIEEGMALQVRPPIRLFLPIACVRFLGGGVKHVLSFCRTAFGSHRACSMAQLLVYVWCHRIYALLGSFALTRFSGI